MEELCDKLPTFFVLVILIQQRQNDTKSVLCLDQALWV